MTSAARTTVPATGFRDLLNGMLEGFQLIGRHLDEALLLRAGHCFQQATDWHLRRPPV